VDCYRQDAELWGLRRAGSRSKRLAAFLVFLSAFACVATAQSNAGVPPPQPIISSPEAFADSHLAALDKQVGLSEELKPLLRDVFLQEGKSLLAVLGDTSLSEAQKLTRVNQIRAASHKRVWSLVTHGRLKPIPKPQQPPLLVSQAASDRQ
jgi:hypothetical protein